MTGKEILDLDIGTPNDAEANTVRDYLKALVSAVVDRGEGFNGKRPFGNSGWIYDLYAPLVRAKLVPGQFDDNKEAAVGCFVEREHRKTANALIQQAIDAL